jgi:hypothetical protein
MTTCLISPTEVNPYDVIRSFLVVKDKIRLERGSDTDDHWSAIIKAAFKVASLGGYKVSVERGTISILKEGAKKKKKTPKKNADGTPKKSIKKTKPAK